MFLSDITEKAVYVGKTPRGICRGVGLSLKSHAVKYLLCSSLRSDSNPSYEAVKNAAISPLISDFSVNAAAVKSVDDTIVLSRLRPVFPKNCAKISIGCPVYSYDGVFLGNIADVELQDFIATRLFTDRGVSYSVLSISACSDAVILRKEQPFPLGQRIPAPLVSIFSDKSDALITKPILREAIRCGGLIRLTLSLSPFRFYLPERKEKRNFFLSR